MGQYIQRRLALSLPILVVITALIFTLLQLTPGDPLDSYIPPDQPLPEAQREVIRRELGLDQPAVIRYFFWLRETARGNLGFRATTPESVLGAIQRSLGPTLLLMGTAMVIGIGAGLALGVVAALKQYSWLDTVLTVVAFLGVSMPVYLAGLIGLYFFAMRLGWFPAGGFTTPGQPATLGDRLHHLILPASIIGLNYVASTMRYTRSAMLDVLGQDYVRTARAKGLFEAVVVRRHALRNALLPVVTIIGTYLPALLGGAVFIESIFSWPGMGRLYLDGVESRDYPLIMGLTLVLAVAILVANLLTDLAYALIDPRIRYG
ncbi:MAG: ABC transporter permease [Chloroflexota bacterium]|nr:ABC transporter permease [Chloroflexota bacterium]